MSKSDDSITLSHLHDLLKETRRDIRTIRDNHLHHIAQDVSGIQSDMAVLTNRVDKVEDVTDEIESWLKDYAKKTIVAILSVGLGSVGYMGYAL